MDTKDNNKKEINNGFFIRRAIEDDINVLTSLSRISFPDQLIWCSKSQAEKTWKRFINSDFQEVWVCQLDDEVVAVIRFEKDVPQCNKEIKELRPDLFPALCYLIMHPGILFVKVFGRIINKYSKNMTYDNEINELAKNSIWFHSCTVFPKMRNKGMGSRMISFCGQRGLELGYDSIKLFTKTSNQDSMRFYERLGFVRAGRIKGHYLYIKMLTKTEDKEFAVSKNEDKNC